MTRCVVLSALSLPASAAAERSEVERLRSEVQELKILVEQLRQRLVTLEAAPAPGESGPRALEERLAAELAAVPPPPRPAAATGGARSYINLSLDGLFAAGTSTSADLARLQTGGHDPAQRGFTVQNVETVLQGAVDPYFNGQANLILQLDPAGETKFELEEAYLTTTSLPGNLQVKAGTYFSEFGRLNTQHPHAWDFVDQPLASGRFLGPDGLRGPGARVSWLVPTPFYSELFLSAQEGTGEIAASFRNVPGEVFLGRPVQERPLRGARDLLLVPRYSASFDLSSTQTALLGVSGAFGPNGSGPDTRTRLLGADLFWKWKPANAQAGFPFVKWQTEVMHRHYQAGSAERDDDGDGMPEVFLPAGSLADWGGYSQVLWGFRRGWVAGLRGDYLRGSAAARAGDPTQEGRWRLALGLTWFPSEFSKLRLQFNHDRFARSGSEQSLWLQLEFLIGAHGAHKF